AAVGKQVDDRQVTEREGDVEDQPDEEDRGDQRHDDVVPGPRPAGSIDASRIQDVARNGSQPGEDDHGAEGKPAPDVYGQDGDVGKDRISQPVRGYAREVGHVDKQPVDDAELGVVHPLPAQQRQRYRHRPGDHQKAPDQLLEAERLKKEERKADTEHALSDLCEEREREGVSQRGQKLRVLEEVGVVAQADEAVVPTGHGDAAHTEVEREEKRVGDENKDVEQDR